MAETHFNGGRTSFDPSDALFLHPSDNPGMVLGFGSWQCTMEIALTAKNKLGFVNGSCKIPYLGSVEFTSWERCSCTVISWILNALSKEIP